MKRFKDILLVSDLKPTGRAALERALALAERNQADLTIVDFLNDLPKSLEKIQEDVLREKQKKMEQDISSVQGQLPNVTCHVLRGRPFVEIIRKVLQDNHDLVIIQAEGKTRFKEHIFGSTSMHLMRKCPCPVWVVKPARRKKYFRILSAVKLSEYKNSDNSLNVKIMDLATSLADWDKSNLHIICAWHLYGESYLNHVSWDELRSLEKETKQELKIKMKKLLKSYNLNKSTTKIHVVKGESISVIPKMVKDLNIDLIVMGTVSRSGLVGILIGNTAESVLQQVNCSVLTVKPDGFISPIK